MALANTRKPTPVPAPKSRPETSTSRRSGEGAPDMPPDLGKDVELRVYRDMLMIRRFEEKAGQMYGMGLIGGFCHLYIGQEGVAGGLSIAPESRQQRHNRKRAH